MFWAPWDGKMRILMLFFFARGENQSNMLLGCRGTTTNCGRFAVPQEFADVSYMPYCCSGHVAIDGSARLVRALRSTMMLVTLSGSFENV